MSFDQLPDELVVMIAKNMDTADVVNLLQTQKRVTNIMKRSKLDKPSFKLVKLRYITYREGPNYMTFNAKDRNGRATYHAYKDLNNKPLEAINFFLSKFYSTKTLQLSSSSEHALPVNQSMLEECFNENSARIPHIEIVDLPLDLTPGNFICFCKMFMQVAFDNCDMRHLLSDETLCQILPHTKFNVIAKHHPRHRLELTDASLEVMSDIQSDCLFFIMSMSSSITVGGIRNLVESSNGKGCLKYLGYLEPKEQILAFEWLTFANRHPELPYKINATNESGRWEFKVQAQNSTYYFYLDL